MAKETTSVERARQKEDAQPTREERSAEAAQHDEDASEIGGLVRRGEDQAADPDASG